jgi:tetratricopeptide (TPR) repeat protein
LEEVTRRHLELAEQRGDDDLMVGRILEKIGRACQGQGKHEEADALYQRAILLNDRWFESNRRAKRFRGGPPSHWITSGFGAQRLNARGNLLYLRGVALSSLGRDAEANRCLAQAERALRRARSTDDARGRTNGLIRYEPAMALAAVLRARGKTAEADALETRAWSEADAASSRDRLHP